MIKQITGQVLDEVVPDTWTSLGYATIKQIQYRTAELIIFECIKIAVLKGDFATVKAIKEHFGVE